MAPPPEVDNCPLATGRKHGLFAATLAAGQRAAFITSLIQCAKLYRHDPYACLEDLLQRLPTQPASGIAQLLPHRWSPQV
jgi:transposase